MSVVGNQVNDKILSTDDLDPSFILPQANGGTGTTSISTVALSGDYNDLLNKYTLPTASTSVLGGVKTDGTVLNTDSNGKLIISDLDYNWSNVSILMHMNGYDGGTTFTNSTGLSTPSISGLVATTRTGSKKFGTASAYFNGNAGYIDSGITSSNFWQNNWTIECWVKPDAEARTHGIIGCRYVAASQYYGAALCFGTDATGKVTSFWLDNYNGNPAATPASVSAASSAGGSWTHLACVNTGGTATWYVNGTNVGSATFSIVNNPGNNLVVGNSDPVATPYPMKGYMDELRVTKNTARYSGSSLTLSTVEFPNGNTLGAAYAPYSLPVPTSTTIGGVKADGVSIVADSSGTLSIAEVDPQWDNVTLLMHMTGSANGTTFINSKTSTTLAITGAVATTQTSVTKVGTSSGYFNGNAGYIDSAVTSSNFWQNDFTVECWVRPDATARTHGIIGCRYWFGGAGYGAALCFTTDATGKITNFFLDNYNGNPGGGSAAVTAASSAALSWTHLAMTRSGTTVYWFVNGTLVNTATLASTSIVLNNPGNSLVVGNADQSATPYPMKGYMDELRVSKVCRYTTSFTPLTIELPNGKTILSVTAYTLPAATTSALGGVIIPAVATSGINNTSGTIGLATASTTQLGGVKVDGTTITVNSGIITAATSGAAGTDYSASPAGTGAVLFLPTASDLADAKGHTLTASAGATWDTSVKKFTSGSLKIAASTDCLSFAPAAEFNITGDYTIEFWAYCTVGGVSFFAFGMPSTTTYDTTGWTIGNNNAQWVASGSGTTVGLGGSAIPLNTWYHFAFVKSGSNFYIYRNGTREVSTTNAIAVSSIPGNVSGKINKIGSAGSGFYATTNMYMSEFILTSGTAKYTGATYTVPTGITTTTIVPGSVQFNNNGLLGGSTTFVYDGYNNYLGLGIASPTELLHVNSGNVKISGTVGTHGLVFPDGTKQTTAASPAMPWQIVTTNTTMVKSTGYFVGANSLTLTLPASPTIGDRISIVDKLGTVTGTVIARNGSNIAGSATDLTVDLTGFRFDLIYTDATTGWIVY